MRPTGWRWHVVGVEWPAGVSSVGSRRYRREVKQDLGEVSADRVVVWFLLSPFAAVIAERVSAVGVERGVSALTASLPGKTHQTPTEPPLRHPSPPLLQLLTPASPRRVVNRSTATGSLSWSQLASVHPSQFIKISRSILAPSCSRKNADVFSVVSGQGLYGNVNAHPHSDTLVAPRLVGRGTARRHRSRGDYPEKLSGYLERGTSA